MAGANTMSYFRSLDVAGLRRAKSRMQDSIAAVLSATLQPGHPDYISRQAELDAATIANFRQQIRMIDQVIAEKSE